MGTDFWRAGSSGPTDFSADGAPDPSTRDSRISSEVEERLDKLTLISWAMWTLIQEATDLTEEDLLKRVKDLDMLDGSADGKATRQVARCPKCDRVMSPRHNRCLYCGAEKLIMGAFDTIT